MIAALLLSASFSMSPGATVEKFLQEWRAGRAGAAYALMSTDAHRVIGQAQVAAYMESRRRALGELIEHGEPRRIPDPEPSATRAMYESWMRFARGRVRAWFMMVRDDRGWAINHFGLELPEGVRAAIEEGEVLPVARDTLDHAARNGLAALADRFSETMLAAVNQDRAAVRAMLEKLDRLLGPLTRYELGDATPLEGDCRATAGKAVFEHGTAAVKVQVCWSDGIWSLKHALVETDITPAMVERMFAILVSGSPKATCPRDVPFPVGGEIVCRLEIPGLPPQNARILRTGESDWKISRLEPVAK